ncbi:hypothetical protein M0802_002344 [Mischocyttarus mexicanus]|nr:hypothetical protein M0802_002344 [Mischocyttarus mexicanus]
MRFRSLLEEEVIPLKGLKQNVSSYTRAVRKAKRFAWYSCADKGTIQVIQVREQVFDTRTVDCKEVLGRDALQTYYGERIDTVMQRIDDGAYRDACTTKPRSRSESRCLSAHSCGFDNVTGLCGMLHSAVSFMHTVYASVQGIRLAHNSAVPKRLTKSKIFYNTCIDTKYSAKLISDKQHTSKDTKFRSRSLDKFYEPNLNTGLKY